MEKSALVVDDSDVIRRLVGFTLRQAGFTVTEACDGREAIERLESGRFDIVITDLNMPRMDGVAFIMEARRHVVHRFVPILMLTTESQEEKRQQGRAAGATAWMVKPFDPDKLVAVVRKVVK